MSEKNGTLLWNRMRIGPIDSGATLTVDTGITQLGKGFPLQSPGEPSMGTAGVAPPPAGTTPASRLHVIPLMPTSAWSGITMSEPFLNTTTGTMQVAFTNNSETEVTTLNVLFWNPHSIVGPGDADTYNAVEIIL